MGLGLTLKSWKLLEGGGNMLISAVDKLPAAHVISDFLGLELMTSVQQPGHFTTNY